MCLIDISYFLLHSNYYRKILENKFKDISIFICTHKQFDDSLFPCNDIYTILANCDSFESKIHNVINISQEDISCRYKCFWSEMCHFYYLYTHQYLLKDYIMITHYRRFIHKYLFHEELIKEDVLKYGVIGTEPWKIYLRNYCTGRVCLSSIFGENPINVFEQIVYDTNNDKLIDAFNETINGTNLIQGSVYCCRKDDFIEMCDIIFPILIKFNDYFKVSSDSELQVNKEISSQFTGWYYRLGGYLSEYLTQTYFTYKYGYDNIQKEILFNGRTHNLDDFTLDYPISELYRNIDIV